MANTYTWDCKTVDVYPEYESNSDVVYNVHFKLSAESDQQDDEGNNYKAVIYSTQQLSVDDIGSFIPFADLTNEVVTNWTISALGEDEIEDYKENLDEQIENQINPISVNKTLDS
jgi:hypothetical protein